jgi:hypothetical protein
MIMKKKKYFEWIAILFLLIANLIVDLILIYQDRQGISPITKEDGVIESIQAITYFLSACLLFFLFIKSKAENGKYIFKAKRNIFFLMLGLICLFAAGEEISWGQRLFGFETTEYFYEHNEQEEMNIHNLRLFQSRVDGEKKSGIKYLLNAQYIAYYFFFFLLLVIPLLHRYSKKSKDFLTKLYFPVTPLWIGYGLVLATVVCETIKQLGLIAWIPIGEVKEANYSTLFFIAIISLVRSSKKEWTAQL